MSTLAFDADSISKRILANITALLEADGITDVKTFYYGPIRRVIDGVAEELASEIGYDEYLTRESKWTPAKNVSSIMAQAQFFSYVPHRKIGAQGYVRVSASPTFSGSWSRAITVPRWNTFSNGVKTLVCMGDPNANYADYSIPTSANYLDVRVVEGSPKTATFEITSSSFPSGTAFAELPIENDSIENVMYDVYVNGVKWAKIDYIRLAESNSDLVYAVKNSYDFSSVIFMFGNDVFGKSLQIGDVVTIRYVETDGSTSNILETANVTTVDDSYVDVADNSVTLYCTNTAAIDGGEDIEDIENIRTQAPLSFQSGNRAITSLDYKTLILKNALADKAIVWGETEINEDAGNPAGTYIPANENLVFISGYNVDASTGLGTILSAASQAAIRTALSDVKGITDIIQFKDADLIYVTYNSTLYITDSRFSPAAVSAAVTSMLENTYGLSAMGFFKNLYFSQYFATISSIAGVDHHETTISFHKLLSLSGAYTFTQRLGLANIKSGTVRIFIRGGEYSSWTQIAHDVEVSPSLGNIVAETGFTITGATITYSFGEMGTIVISSGLAQTFSNYSIRIDFSISDSEEGNIVLINRQQALGFYSAAITIG